MNMGKPKDETEESILGEDNTYVYKLGLILGLIAIAVIPIMLCAKPCCFRGGKHEDPDLEEIEFSDIRQ